MAYVSRVKHAANLSPQAAAKAKMNENLKGIC